MKDHFIGYNKNRYCFYFHMDKRIIFILVNMIEESTRQYNGRREYKTIEVRLAALYFTLTLLSLDKEVYHQ